MLIILKYLWEQFAHNIFEPSLLKGRMVKCWRLFRAYVYKYNEKDWEKKWKAFMQFDVIWYSVLDMQSSSQLSECNILWETLHHTILFLDTSLLLIPKQLKILLAGNECYI